MLVGALLMWVALGFMILDCLGGPGSPERVARALDTVPWPLLFGVLFLGLFNAPILLAGAQLSMALMATVERWRGGYGSREALTARDLWMLWLGAPPLLGTAGVGLWLDLALFRLRGEAVWGGYHHVASAEALFAWSGLVGVFLIAGLVLRGAWWGDPSGHGN